LLIDDKEEADEEVGSNEGLLTNLEIDADGAREDLRVEVEAGGGIAIDFLGAVVAFVSDGRVEAEGLEASIRSARVVDVVLFAATPVVDRLLVIPPSTFPTVNLVPTELLLFNPPPPAVPFPPFGLELNVSSSLTLRSLLILSNLARVDSFRSPGVLGASGRGREEEGGRSEERARGREVVEGTEGAGVARVDVGRRVEGVSKEIRVPTWVLREVELGTGRTVLDVILLCVSRGRG